MNDSNSDVEKAWGEYSVDLCFLDEKRVEAFRKAIMNLVKPGDIVADFGSGNGLLGMFAIQAGASKVYSVEISQDNGERIKLNAAMNNMSDKIEVICQDATTISELPQLDVIITEIISAGFWYEPQLQVMNNVLRFLKPNGHVIPSGMDNFVELIDAEQVKYGLNWGKDTRWDDWLGDEILTDRVMYDSVSFYQKNNPNIKSKVIVEAKSDSIANAIRVPYVVHLIQGSETQKGMSIDEPSASFLNPQIVYLPEPVALKKGQKYQISLEYQASSHPRRTKVQVEALRITDLELSGVIEKDPDSPAKFKDLQADFDVTNS